MVRLLVVLGAKRERDLPYARPTATEPCHVGAVQLKWHDAGVGMGEHDPRGRHGAPRAATIPRQLSRCQSGVTATATTVARPMAQRAAIPAAPPGSA